MSHHLTFAARAWRDSAGAVAGELLVVFEPRAVTADAGACPPRGDCLRSSAQPASQLWFWRCLLGAQLLVVPVCADTDDAA